MSKSLPLQNLMMKPNKLLALNGTHVIANGFVAGPAQVQVVVGPAAGVKKKKKKGPKRVSLLSIG